MSKTTIPVPWRSHALAWQKSSMPIQTSSWLDGKWQVRGSGIRYSLRSVWNELLWSARESPPPPPIQNRTCDFRRILAPLSESPVWVPVGSRFLAWNLPVYRH